MEYSTAYKTLWMQAIACVLLLCFSCTAVGTAVLFFSARYQVRKEVKTQLKQGVPEYQLTRFVFSNTHSPTTVQWIHEREFRLHNTLYDVVRSEQHGDSTVYYCLNDHAEQRLFANLDALLPDAFGTSKSATTKAMQIAVKHLVWHALAPAHSQRISYWKQQVRIPCLAVRKTHLCSLSIPTPPPWLLHTT